MAIVQETQKLRVKGTLTQDDAQLVFDALKSDPGKLPEVKLAGDIGWRHNGREALLGSSIQVFNGASAMLPHPMLGVQGGGEAMVDPRDQQGLRAAEGHFEFRVDLDNAASQYVPGQRAYIRMKIMNRPLFWQGARYVMQLIQKRTGESSWL